MFPTSYAEGTRRNTCQTNKLVIPVQLISLSRLAVICEVKLDTQALVALMPLHEAQRMQLHPATTSQQPAVASTIASTWSRELSSRDWSVPGALHGMASCQLGHNQHQQLAAITEERKRGHAHGAAHMGHHCPAQSLSNAGIESGVVGSDECCCNMIAQCQVCSDP
jgi:hypothetical protein